MIKLSKGIGKINSNILATINTIKAVDKNPPRPVKSYLVIKAYTVKEVTVTMVKNRTNKTEVLVNIKVNAAIHHPYEIVNIVNII
jgi:hypothetical protein